MCYRGQSTILSTRWFGDAGQPPGICEVPLETFVPALDRLAELSDHLGIVGVSKGAEAALLLGARDERVRVVAALSPSSVVWANIGPGLDGKSAPLRSSWTQGGRPIPFVPYDGGWIAPDVHGAPAYRGLYEQSLVTFADRVPAATIPVERIRADVLVTGGGDDQVWPSGLFAEQIVRRRARHRAPTRIVTDPKAGHRVRLPTEPELVGGSTMARGGSAVSDALLGEATWRHLVDLLRLNP